MDNKINKIIDKVIEEVENTCLAILATIAVTALTTSFAVLIWKAVQHLPEVPTALLILPLCIFLISYIVIKRMINA